MCCPAPSYKSAKRSSTKPPRTAARHRGGGSRPLSRYTSSLCRIGRSSIFIDGGKGASLLNGEERLPPYPATRQYRVGPRTAAPHPRSSSQLCDASPRAMRHKARQGCATLCCVVDLSRPRRYRAYLLVS